MEAHVRIEMFDGKKYDFIKEVSLKQLSPLKLEDIDNPPYLVLEFKYFGIENLEEDKECTHDTTYLGRESTTDTAYLKLQYGEKLYQKLEIGKRVDVLVQKRLISKSDEAEIFEYDIIVSGLPDSGSGEHTLPRFDLWIKLREDEVPLLDFKKYISSKEKLDEYREKTLEFLKKAIKRTFEEKIPDDIIKENFEKFINDGVQIEMLWDKKFHEEKKEVKT